MKLILLVLISFNCNGFTPAYVIRPPTGLIVGLKRRRNNGMRKTTRYSSSECWEPGDFDNDLRNLKYAVVKSNARTSLEETERIHLLKAIARQKRELFPDLKKMLLVLLAAFSYSSIYIFYGSSSKVISRLLHIPVMSMNVLFAIFTVHVPIISFLIARSTYRPKPRRKNEFEAEFVDLSEDCSNYSLCLLEAWVTAVWPSFFLIWFSVALQLLSSHNRMNIKWILGISVSQLLTRVGTATAIHQFPILLYKLQNSRRNGPIQLLPYVVQRLVATTMNTLAVGFVMDVTSVASTFLRTRDLPLKQTASLVPSVKSISLTVLLMLSILSNFVHFLAFKKLVRIGKFTNIPLIPNTYPADIDDTVKLRYRLHWREPKRLFPSLRRITRRFTTFIFSGWGEGFSIKVGSAHLPHILSLVDKESEMGAVPPRNRHLWISNASKGIAKVHEENYRNKSFHDPLGIALYKTFGVGMSMDFDHTSPLEQNEEPSIHRLRARAAKSAIKCYNDIPDIVASENEGISDPKMKESIVRKEIQRRRDILKSDVKNLMLMLPSNAPAPEGKELEILTMKRSDLKSVQLNESLPPGLQIHEDEDDDENGPRKGGFIDPYLNDEIFEDTVFV